MSPFPRGLTILSSTRLRLRLRLGEQGRLHQPQLPLLPALLHLLQVVSKQSFQRGHQPGHRGEVSEPNLEGRTEKTSLSEEGACPSSRLMVPHQPWGHRPQLEKERKCGGDGRRPKKGQRCPTAAEGGQVKGPRKAARLKIRLLRNKPGPCPSLPGFPVPRGEAISGLQGLC